MVLTIVLIILFLFVVKSSSGKDRTLNTGHYTRFRRRNREERRVKRDPNTRI